MGVYETIKISVLKDLLEEIEDKKVEDIKKYIEEEIEFEKKEREKENGKKS